jgi:photosynthetic reaction center H subunit
MVILRLFRYALIQNLAWRSQDRDPRGLPVLGADDEVAGTVGELWVDRSEMLFRYIEVKLADSGKAVLIPINFARITKDSVKVQAIYADQFADVPGVRTADQITMLEEEKIMAYYGAGTLYADPFRQEPLA